jgi:hypothetical protein
MTAVLQSEAVRSSNKKDRHGKSPLNEKSSRGHTTHVHRAPQIGKPLVSAQTASKTKIGSSGSKLL